MKKIMVVTIGFKDVLETAQKIECHKEGIEYKKGEQVKLPSGKDPIYERLWELISKRQRGNQVFNNDSLYRFTFKTFNGEPMSEDEQFLYAICRGADAIVDETVVFDVSW